MYNEQDRDQEIQLCNSRQIPRIKLLVQEKTEYTYMLCHIYGEALIVEFEVI